jgi:CSLREA domain-containing protein
LLALLAPFRIATVSMVCRCLGFDVHLHGPRRRFQGTDEIPFQGWIVCAIALVLSVGAAGASTIAVTSLADSSDPGKCTLREAITAANTNAPVGACVAGSAYPAVDTITINFSSSYCKLNVCAVTLASPLPALTEPVNIIAGVSRIAVSGANAFRIFDVQGVDVGISNLRLINGRAVGTGNAGYGGAIRTSTLGGALTLTNVILSGNHAQTRGGALFVESGPTVTATDCTFDNNTVDTFGGAIDQVGGILIINSSTISNNTAASGGGLEIQSASETRMTNVTFSGNSATGDGGAIARIGTDKVLSLNNVTITNNTADSDSNGSGDGGGIRRGGGTITISNSIIAGNFDTPNNAGPGQIFADCFWPGTGGFTSFGYNVIGRGEGAAGFTNGVNNDKVGSNATPLDPKVVPLAFNGGLTQTHTLSAGSPALDGGNPLMPGGGGFGACAPTDQRGVTRPIDGDGNNSAICDSGSVEAPLTTPTPTPTPTATPTATPTPTPAGTLGNISTRLQVGTGDDVLFAGFIIRGGTPKKVLIRSAGPSLVPFGVSGVLINPQLELHDANNTIGTNDNWQTTQLGGVITSDQVAEIQNTGAAPSSTAEPAIIATLGQGSYSAIVKGVANTEGVATVEVYDLTLNNGSALANISTRGFVRTGDNVMIGGFTVLGQPSKLVVRATGPSLLPFGVSNALANPQLELHDSNGTLAANNDWQTTQIGGIITGDQAAAIQSSGLAPSDAAESAIIATLAPGQYTAIAQGVNGATGVGLVEVYTVN